MSAIIKFRDGSGTTDQNNIDLGTAIPGNASPGRKFSLVNTGDTAATGLQIQPVGAPYVTNSNGTPVVSATGNGAALTAGSYALTFVANASGSNPQGTLAMQQAGKIAASQEVQYHPAYLAFDKDYNSYFACANFDFNGNSTTPGGEYIFYDYGTAVGLNQYSITVAASSPGLSNFFFEGSNDSGATWTTLDTQAPTSWAGGETKTYNLAAGTGSYIRYRVRMTKLNVAVQQIAITEIVLTSIAATPFNCLVNGSGSTGIVADGSTRNSSVIAGLDIVFSASLAAANTATLLVNDGWKYIEIAPDVSGSPGAWQKTPFSIASLASSTSTFTFSGANALDASLTNASYGKNFLPAMTGASTAFNGNTYVISGVGSPAGDWALFNQNGSYQNWVSFLSDGSSYTTIDLGVGNAQVCNAYSMAVGLFGLNYYSNYVQSRPSAWRLEGSNDNANWTTLSSVSGATTSIWSDYKRTGFPTSGAGASVAYRYFRFTWLQVSISGVQQSNVTLLSQIELFQSSPNIPAGTYNYAISGTLSDGRTLAPARTTVTVPAGQGGSRNNLSFSPAAAGISQVAVYAGVANSEKLVALLSPTATTYSDTVGLGGTIHSASSLLFLCNFENPAWTTGLSPNGAPLTPCYGQGFIGLVDPLLTMVSSPVMGTAIRTHGGTIDASTSLLAGTTGSLQMVFSNPGSTAGTRGYIQIGDPASAAGAILVYDNQGTIVAEYWKSGSISTAMGTTQIAAANVSPSVPHLLTVNWGDPVNGVTIYIDSTLAYKITGMTGALSGVGSRFDGETPVAIGKAGGNASDVIYDDFAIFSQPQTAQQMAGKVSILQGNPSSLTAGSSSTAQMTPFWLRQNPPGSVVSSVQNKAFSLLITGNSL